MRAALTAAARPTSLKASRREVRWNRLAPSRASSRLTALETVAFERLRSAAARANDPVSATLAKMAQASRSGRRGMTMFPKRCVSIVSLYVNGSKQHIADYDQQILMKDPDMPKVLILYYSSYGHIEAMAQAVAEGARSARAEVDVKRVPETVPEEVARKSGYKLDQAAPIATVEELPTYDAIIVGTGIRYGRLSSQMAAFLDRTGGLWARGALNGKVGAAFTSTATQHGGQETTLFSLITNLLHFGMVVVGLPYSFQGQMRLDEVTGGAPYGATTIAGGDGSRQPKRYRTGRGTLPRPPRGRDH